MCKRDIKSKAKDYGQKYFEGIYAHLKKEKALILESFFGLLLSRVGKIEKILDLGCGEGEFLKICEEAGLDCFGVDVSPYAIAKATKKVRGKFLGADLEKDRLPYPDNFFDAITSFDILEHLGDSKLVLREAQRVLKDGGILFLTTPNAGYWLGGFLGRFIPGDSSHVNIQGEKYWYKELKKAGFSVVEIKGCLLFGFPPNLDLRYFLRKLKIPVLTQPIFFPIIELTSELFIFARKGASLANHSIK